MRTITKSAVYASVILAHSFYSTYCCDDKDCFPIRSCELLVEQSDGSYKYTETGHIIPTGHIYPSHDSKCHVCIYNGVGRCAYILSTI